MRTALFLLLSFAEGGGRDGAGGGGQGWGGAEAGKQLVADAGAFAQVGGVGDDEVGDSQVGVFAQGGGYLVVGADQPGGGRAAAADAAGRGVEARVEDLGPVGQGEQPLLADRPAELGTGGPGPV